MCPNYNICNRNILCVCVCVPCAQMADKNAHATANISFMFIAQTNTFNFAKGTYRMRDAHVLKFRYIIPTCNARDM